MSDVEGIRAAKEIVQGFLKAKKTIRIYPDNNPVYIKTVEELFSKFQEFFTFAASLDLKIKQNELLLGSGQVYHNLEKDDNLALFFFKDGLRELSFKNDLSKQELEEFLKIIALDFDREAVDDDVVTLLWERDFHSVKYVADEAFLFEDDSYESEAVAAIKSKAPENDELYKAYIDAFHAEDVKEVSIVNLSDKDLQSLVVEIEKDAEEKIGKLSEILFEMLFLAENAAESEDISHFLSDVIVYTLEQGDLGTTINILNKARDIAETLELFDETKRHLRRLSSPLSTPQSIAQLGEILDSSELVDEEVLKKYVSFLDKSAIAPFVSILGDMKGIHGRKHVINILAELGKKDLPALAKGLQDPRWYLVRNIIYILRQIGDKKAVEYLLSAARHSDVRVRKESIKALGELKSPLALQTLRDSLDDPDESMRKAAARSLGAIGSGTAKRILMVKVSEKDFMNRDFEEKREFYEALTRWNDPEMIDFMMRVLKKKTFFKRARSDENRACAAYSLGLMGSKDLLPVLFKLRDSSSGLLREYANAAIKRIEHGI